MMEFFKLDLSKQQKLFVGAAAIAIILVILFLIPNGEDKSETVDLNSEMTQPTTVEINGNTVRQTPMNSYNDDVVEQMCDIMQQHIAGDTTEVETPRSDTAQVNAVYREVNRTLDNFYQDRTPMPTQKSEQELEIERLREQIRRQQQLTQPSVDEQMEVMERSYELAAKYINPQPTIEVVQPKVEERESYIVAPVASRVVSSLSATSDREFISPLTAKGKIVKNTISATIIADQRVSGGEPVRLRLSESMVANGVTIPRGSTITAIANMRGERLNLTIEQVEHEGLIIPIKLRVYDSDGIEGVYIPNSAEVSAIKEIAANMGNTVGSAISFSSKSAGGEILSDLGTGAIQGVSNYAKDQIQEVRVHLKSGYKVMLLNSK